MYVLDSRYGRIYECEEIFVSCHERYITKCCKKTCEADDSEFVEHVRKLNVGDRLPIYSISLICRHRRDSVSLSENYYSLEEADKALEAILENMKDGKVKI